MPSFLAHGAIPDISTVQTDALQATLDACAAAGGGTVTVPPGTFITGTLRLRDHVTLHLDNGARLLGSDDLADYPEVVGGFTDAVGQSRNRALLYAEGATGVAVTGQGILDGNGSAFAKDAPGRPFLLRFIDCTDVQVIGVTLQNSPGWVSHYLGCENVLLSGLTIRSHVNSNNDGIDIDSCRRVRVTACDIDTGDDAVCLKSTRATPCENIVITGCVIRSTWGALKIGTESAGDFRNIVISDCVIRETCGGALKIISMDGARIENISASNLLLDRVSGPIFIRLGSRLRRYHADQPARPVGCIRGVTLRNITGTVWEEGYLLYGKLPRKAGIILTGIEGHCLEDIHISDVRLTFPGGAKPADTPARDVPEQPAEYPEFPSFHPLPAWGLFLRHARHVTLRDVDLRLAHGSADTRPAMFTSDVTDLRSLAVLGSNLS